MEFQELKDAVVNLLVSKHEFIIDDAETLVEESATDQPDLWNKNADADDLANFLATDGEES